ncbi:MAG: ATP-grasp domain-containing protein [Deltaproteobacteria bacterium]|nr:ATP-grasp domain-containing protein [Deltaproteobacteria bacterium]
MSVKGKTILIISGGVEAVPIIAEAKAMGLNVAVSDGNAAAPGFDLADFRLVASTYEPEKTAELARDLSARHRIDGVMAAAADVPCTVAAVAEALGLPSTGHDAARIVSDKFLMKEIFKNHGVPIPWFGLVESGAHLKVILQARNVVIKPVDSRGARGVIRVTPGVDPEWAYSESLKHSPSGRVMAEEWVSGRQISTESIVTEDGVMTPGLSDRNYQYLERFAPFVIEDGGDLPALLTDDERKAIDTVISCVADSLSIRRGTIKGDIVMGKDGPVVIEVAIRLSGGYFCSHTIPLSTGANFVEAAILLALGEKIDINEYRPRFSRSVCQRFIFPEPGTITRVEVPEIKDENLMMMRVYVKEGDKVVKMTSHPCRAGMAITSGDTREEAQKTMARALSKIIVEVSPAMTV